MLTIDLQHLQDLYLLCILQLCSSSCLIKGFTKFATSKLCNMRSFSLWRLTNQNIHHTCSPMQEPCRTLKHVAATGCVWALLAKWLLWNGPREFRRRPLNCLRPAMRGANVICHHSRSHTCWYPVPRACLSQSHLHFTLVLCPDCASGHQLCCTRSHW